MKCCGIDLGKGTPYVLTQYWCDKCKTEHLVEAVELTEYIKRLHAEKDNGGQQLPDIL